MPDQEGRFLADPVGGQDDRLPRGLQILHDHQALQSALHSGDLREGDPAQFPSHSGGTHRPDAQQRHEKGGVRQI